MRVTSSPRILRPTAEPAQRAILVGDPGRALMLAQSLLETPAPMFNHHRGLWGYSGAAADGSGPLTIQATGIGGPSINAVASDLHSLGIGRMLRLGTAASTRLRLSDMVIAVEAESLTDEATAAADGAMARIAQDSLPDAAVGKVISSSSHIDPGSDPIPSSALAADLSTATLYATAEKACFPTLSLLCIAETAEGTITDDDLGSTIRETASAALACHLLG